MILTLMVVVFVLGYLAIAMEHVIHIDKSASALITAVVLWALYSTTFEHSDLGATAAHVGKSLDGELMHHMGEISSILFFLIGAMTMVELIDSHGGFELITDRITTKNKRKLLWIISLITFSFSAVLDNLTTAIVMATLSRKLIHNPKDLFIFGGFIVLAANAGGAFSPIGDVTTTMLWVGGQISTVPTVTSLFLPSMACLLVPLCLYSFKLKGNIETNSLTEQNELFTHTKPNVTNREKSIVFYTGFALLLFVPVFKQLTHLQPFIGILFGLGVLWILTELIHNHKDPIDRRKLSVTGVLEKIDTPSVLFFLGILLAVGALQSAGHLQSLANSLGSALGDKHSLFSIYTVNILLGACSSVIDNVPIVAAAKGMYSLADYEKDSLFWQLLAFCSGTGGSALIIGSAAGVAVMGVLRIDFGWYLKNMSLLAILGYASGILVYYIQQSLVG